MVFAPGGGRGPLPLFVAIIFVVVGPTILWFTYETATEDPKPVILTCTRERADLLACDPGNVRGAQAIARSQTGKNAKRCFTLGNTWMSCGGKVDDAAAKVNALAIGAKTEVDVTPVQSVAAMFVSAALAILMFAVGIHRLFGNSRKSSKSS